ncbi:MAG: hypothetical protein KTR15_04980 [Phycisphaeraceae bacterium]|nr:hypothetical protein [Phycisphaeraceae bacterium]
MQRKQHPNHHLPPMIIAGALFAGLLTVAVTLGVTLDDRTLLFIIVGVMAVSETVTGIIVVAQMLKRCQWPGCKRFLERDPGPAARGIQFPCEACATAWVSKIGGGSIKP